MQHTTEEIYVPCLMALCKSLWGIMNSFHKTSKWHQEEFEQKCDGMKITSMSYVKLFEVFFISLILSLHKTGLLQQLCYV